MKALNKSYAYAMGSCIPLGLGLHLLLLFVGWVFLVICAVMLGCSMYVVIVPEN